MIELIDTHCHLTEPPLVDDLSGVLERAAARGVSGVIAPAYDLASWATVEAVERTQRARGVRVAYGLHPWVAAEPLERRALERALERPGVVAVGEVGLDFKIEGADRAAQLEGLRLQLEVAAELDLPVLLHCRGAFEELLGLLGSLRRQGRAVRGVLHAYSRSPELARRLLDLGLHLAFGGTITYPTARARRSAAVVPLSRLLLETDAPSIGMRDLEPARIEPAHVRDIAETLTQIRDEPLEVIAAATTNNARTLFSLDSAP